MLSVIVLDTLWEEEVNVSTILKKTYTRRDLPIKRLAVFKELSVLRQNTVEQVAQYNVLIISFSKMTREYVEFAQHIKHEKQNLFIVFVVGKNVDIGACVKPSVQPAGILSIPLEELRLMQTIREIYVQYLHVVDQEKQPVFTIKSGGDYFSINTGEISFFEADGKKIAVKTRGQEIKFYSNFEAILEQLPDWFIRCHKGYVVNARQIFQVSFTDMLLTLKDQCKIPISRTYKDEVRAFLEPEGISNVRI